MNDAKLRVMEAMRQAWRMIVHDFWPIWLVGFVAFAIEIAGNIVGQAPFFIGFFLTMLISVFVQPQLQAGLAYAFIRMTDGASADVGDLFEGFRSRYWASIAVMLPLWGIGVVAIMIGVGIILMIVLIPRRLGVGSSPDFLWAPMGVLMVIVMPLAVFFAVILQAVAWFAFIALWEDKESAWVAFRSGWRLAFDNVIPTAKLMLVFGVVTFAAALSGALALCVGILFTLPIVTAWMPATLVRLYRSWRPHLEATT